MRKTLFIATILGAGTITVLSAQAAPQLRLAGPALSNSTDILVVREAAEGPRRNDNANDRKERGASRATPGNASGIMLVREAAEGPRGHDPD